jgi:lysyl-tRNA synthetase class 2
MSSVPFAMELWRPSASLETIRRYAEFRRSIRRFFEERAVLEVDTPLLSHSTATDPHLESFEVVSSEHKSPQFLLTSPEFEMKRLLAAGSGPVFQMTKAFRRGEVGRLHNPEFSMLEWYRPAFSLTALSNEVADLLHYLGYQQTPLKLSYRQAFLEFAGLDPFLSTSAELLAVARKESSIDAAEIDRADALDIIMTHCIEPQLAASGAVYIFDYPAHQAALARVSEDQQGALVAKRFELYLHGIEIANAYDELTCASEQKARFHADNEKRLTMNKPAIPADHRLLAAMSQLPQCVGIAVGLDRLFMVLEGYSSLQEVMAFPYGSV